MLKLICEQERLVEMAIINPIACKNKTIQAEVEQSDEGPVPHIHVYHDKTRNPEKCSCIRLDKCDYYSNHANGITLPKKLKSEFIEVMNELCPNAYMQVDDKNVIQATGYQHAVQVWADTFENGDLSKFQLDENGYIKQVDYENL